MDGIDAAKCLMWEARSTQRHSNASAKRVLKACVALRVEPFSIFYWLEYCDRSGDSFSPGIKPIWNVQKKTVLCFEGEEIEMHEIKT
jgi:hypothetical protein